MIVPSIERAGNVIPLTDDEAYRAFKYYSTKFRIPQVKIFISENLLLEPNKILTEDECYSLASEYEKELQKGFTECYAMALVVIPYLERKGIDIPVNAEYFISYGEIGGSSHDIV